MTKTFHLISLGCAKNLVDSELLLGKMHQLGYAFVNEPESADILLLNTCGFIQPAVEEAIDEILYLAEIKKQFPVKKLIVIGCLIQRYQGNLVDEFPEVDFFLGTDAANHIERFVSTETLHISGHEPRLVIFPVSLMTNNMPRILATPGFRAYCKITEGCGNNCSYCMIPAIRGRLRSRTSQDILEEAQSLSLSGVKELSLIAQDLTAYGKDLGVDGGLVPLLTQLLQQTEIPWIRLLYLYPTGIQDELLELMAANPRVVPYLDIPFQHASTPVLQRMNRRYTGEDIYKLVERIRRKLPDIALRTTFLVGFPGETENDFRQIHDLMTDLKLNHVGVFPYANEEGCPSEHFDQQVPDEVKIDRQQHLLELQSTISLEVQKKYIGRIEEVLVEGVSSETELLLEGRTCYQAPEVDGCVYITDGIASPGDLVRVEITDAQVYDLVGAIVD